MKYFLTLIASLLLANTAFADRSDLTVLRIGFPGSFIEHFTTPMSNRLSERGWNTKLIGFNDCQGAEQWVKDHPREPVVYMVYIDQFILPYVQPDHPRACPGLNVTEKSLVLMPNRVYHNLCSIDKSLNDLLTMKNPKVATWNHPVQVSSLKTLLKDLGVSAKIVEYPAAAKSFQALASGDVDFAIASYETLISNIKGQCFLTTAPADIAKNMNNLRGGKRTSINELVANPSRPGTGAVPIYVSYNTDIALLQKDMVSIFTTAPEYNNLWSASTIKAGMVAGKSSKEQWADFQTYLEKFRKK